MEVKAWLIYLLFFTASIPVYAQAKSSLHTDGPHTSISAGTAARLSGGKTSFLSAHFGCSDCTITIDSMTTQNGEQFYAFHSEQQLALIPSWGSAYIRLIREFPETGNFAVEIWVRPFSDNSPIVFRECCVSLLPDTERD